MRNMIQTLAQVVLIEKFVILDIGKGKYQLNV